MKQLPVFTVGHRELSQSMAIARYVAREHGIF